MGGAQAGLAGGIAMILSAALLAGFKGYDIWFQLKSIASLVLGPAAIAQAGFVGRAGAAGAGDAPALSALLGAIFAIGMRQVLRLPSDFGVPVVAGLVFGLLLWLASVSGLAGAAATADCGLRSRLHHPAHRLRHCHRLAVWPAAATALCDHQLTALGRRGSAKCQVARTLPLRHSTDLRLLRVWYRMCSAGFSSTHHVYSI